MKFEYFGAHGRGLQVRALLDYCGGEWEDAKLDRPSFGAKKAAGAFKFGQVPCLHLDDGTVINQTRTIMRYIGTIHKGDELYPKSDPALVYQIEE